MSRYLRQMDLEPVDRLRHLPETINGSRALRSYTNEIPSAH